MTLSEYIVSINKRYKLGNSTEHTFRGDLQNLMESLVPSIRATNEPKRQSCGAPDYIITKSEIPIGFIEAKNIGDKDLEGTKKAGNKEQFDRYKASLGNLIFTDYLDFHLYRDGQFIMKIAIGEKTENGINPLLDNFSNFESFISDFCSHVGQTIKNSKRLAEMMAGKARLLSDVIERALLHDEKNHESSTLKEQLNAFKHFLIHDINAKGFADIYAQTIAYGMFAARLHDPTLPTFSRQEAAELIPKSNPFLRKQFGYIAGPDIDDRIKWIVDSLVDIFLHCNVEELLKNYGKATKMEDPIIHFYETFLSEYDPKLRKARGVWYTPQPVVNFIVRAVDDILKSEFELPTGLADNGKIRVKSNIQGKKSEQEFHKVQILDPATGTGTFLAEVIRQVYKTFEGQQGIWSSYVETQLLARLNGFELLMASYAMAHLKLDLLLKETGYKSKFNQRFKVYLTNSLEESHPDSGTLFGNWLSAEANEANQIKRESPVMCVIGNPPYSKSSTNRGEWIENLTADYKKNLNERNIQPLSDDYIKFIRFGQHFIDKNGAGVLGYITNNSFIDGLIHRQMRKSLIDCFDKIYILDLHGSAKRKEVAEDGSRDENVFDIQQGVSINLFIKKSRTTSKKPARLYKYDIFGKREHKYNFLSENNISSVNWSELGDLDEQYSFKKFEKSSLNDSNSFAVDKLFLVNASGITTERDDLTIQYSPLSLKPIKSDFAILTEDEIRTKYNLGADGRDWKIKTAKQDLIQNNPEIVRVLYRPFDHRYTLYTGKSKGFHSYPRSSVMSHLANGENLALIIGRQGQAIGDKEWNIVYISNSILDCNIFYRGRGTAFILYQYPISKAQATLKHSEDRIPNLNLEVVRKFESALSLEFSNEKTQSGNQISPIDLLDYIYAVLHSPKYRIKYKEYLKTDFPRMPYPKRKEQFWQFVRMGARLRDTHLLNGSTNKMNRIHYPEEGNNKVSKPIFDAGKVYINETQYFNNVPDTAWNFSIGGYQPAQKWLKDRKDIKLEYEDIIHYQKLINALNETDKIMKEINELEL